jgi:FtsH-binding integral membrane protein
MGVHLNPIYLVVAVAAWLLIYHLTYRLALILRDPSLICWGVGLFGMTTISLRKTRASLLVSQFIYAALAMGCVVYFTLFVVQPTPIAGIPHTGSAILTVVVAPVALVTLIALLAQARGRRYALWGEARVLSAAQRATTLGVVLYFTPLGRAFLHDRFNATPSEFLQTIRS